MRLCSEYYTYCICGAEIQSTAEEGTCPECGQRYRIEFAAKHDPPTKESTITGKYEE